MGHALTFMKLNPFCFGWTETMVTAPPAAQEMKLKLGRSMAPRASLFVSAGFRSPMT